jgi:AraC-type DNA-binding domain-containing proteins
MVNLKPGDYHVEVQASLFPDQWQEDLPDDQRFVWIVHVKEPWWRTTGLYVLLGAVLLALLIVNFYFFNKNTRMRVRRNSEEGDIIRKIRFFAERCEDYANRPLTPVGEDLSGASDSADKLNPEFIDIMMKLIPFINTHNERQLNMRQLSEAGGVDIVKLYGIVSGNLYKNPRELARVINLQKAAELLSTTDMSIEQIAMECKFYTPNYFIGNFFHEYKMTPQEYRRQA